jgi:mandelate racemase
MRVTETALWLEWQDWANPILQQPYEVKDGKLHIPERGGRRAEVGREGSRRSPG